MAIGTLFLNILLVSTFGVTVFADDVIDKVIATVEKMERGVKTATDSLSELIPRYVLLHVDLTREAVLDERLFLNLSSIAERLDELKTAAADENINIDMCIKDSDLNITNIVDDVMHSIDLCAETYSTRVHKAEKAIQQKYLNYLADARAIASKILSCGGEEFCAQVVQSRLTILQNKYERKDDREVKFLNGAFALAYSEMLNCGILALDIRIDDLSNHIATAEYCYHLLRN